MSHDFEITTADANSGPSMRAAINTMFQYLAPLEASTTVTVGAGGDFATINAALEELSMKYPAYRAVGVTATIQLLTGFVMAEQVIVSGLNLGWITITSVDATVTIAMSALTVMIEAYYPAFSAIRGGTLPIISTLFQMDTTGTSASRIGIHCKHSGSAVTVNSAKGVKNAGAYGLAVFSGASANVSYADFSGAGWIGIFADKGSLIEAHSSVVTGCGVAGIRAWGGSKIDAIAANAQMGGSPAVTDFVVASGGVIVKHGGTGGVSQAINTITTDGIIFG